MSEQQQDVKEQRASDGAPIVASPSGAPVLEVRDLQVDAPSGAPIVEDISFSLGPGEALGVVGESGSGKTTSALALLGYTQGGAKIASGTVTVAGETVRADDEKAARRMRGRFVSYVPQNPGTALNPSMRIGSAISAMIQSHRESGSASADLVGSALTNVNLPGDRQFQRRYPHQLSGGQQQRVCISVSLVCEPPLVVLDEPTTGLDVVTQAHILGELTRLRHEQGVSLLYVTHDLAVVAQIATRIAVMYAGRIVEEGPAREILQRPKHPYTRGLLSSIPDHLEPRVLEPMPGVSVGVGERPQGCSFAPRCPLRTDACEEVMPDLLTVGEDHRARCIHAAQVNAPDLPRIAAARTQSKSQAPLLSVSHLRSEHRSRTETVVAAEDVSFTVDSGRCVALVGESGSGKTTIARTIVGLHPIAGGEIQLGGEALPGSIRKRSAEQRRRIQIVFQNPADALNPRHTVRSAIARPASLLRNLSRKDADQEVDRLLELVRLSRRSAGRYPGELSGGERQRVGIARALVAQPDILVCDEVTSALDVSVQAAVLDLLENLRRDLGLGLLFITHDLGVVATIADHVLVLDQGQVSESGTAVEILRNPTQPYTKHLLGSAPSISHALEEWEEVDAGTYRPPSADELATDAEA
jgi:peptide/nickel transport system ATP-binding protein